MRTPEEVWADPTRAWALEAAIINMERKKEILLLAGLGIEGALAVSNPRLFMQATEIARHQTPARWRNLDIRYLHTIKCETNCTLDILASLAPAGAALTQEALDFITLKDQKQPPALNAILLGSSTIEEVFVYDEQDMRLATAWRRQLVDEAEPYRPRLMTGAYIMQREPLPALDALLGYNELRLIITPTGMFVSVIANTNEGTWMMPFWWSPLGDTNTSQIHVSPRVRFLLDVLCAALWRDACVVREVDAFKRTSGTAYESPRRTNKPQHDNPLMFPRKVYRVQWGTDEERAEIERRAARAHDVRAHYRWLGERNASDTAAANAEAFGFPAPPAGFTFVRPHVRGEGERAGDVKSAPRRAIFRGLQTAKILLA